MLRARSAPSPPSCARVIDLSPRPPWVIIPEKHANGIPRPSTNPQHRSRWMVEYFLVVFDWVYTLSTAVHTTHARMYTRGMSERISSGRLEVCKSYLDQFQEPHLLRSRARAQNTFINKIGKTCERTATVAAAEKRKKRSHSRVRVFKKPEEKKNRTCPRRTRPEPSVYY